MVINTSSHLITNGEWYTIMGWVVATLDNMMEPFGSEKRFKLAYMVIVIRV
jgi:hypothetical protein